MKNLRRAEFWSGVWTALVSPLNSKKEIDELSLERLIEAQIEAGIQGLVIAGSTGEGSLLPPHTYEALLEGAQAFCKGRIPLVAGIGIGGTASCLKNIEIARKHQYSGVLAAPPAYIKAPQRGLKEHYLKLAQGGLPICIYEIPGRAAVSLSIDSLTDLAHDPSTLAQNLIAIKDATALMDRALEQKRLLKNRFSLLSGDDGSFLPFLSCGGSGIISVASHLLPRSMKFIFESFQSGKLESALNEQLRITPLIQALFWESNPIPIKTLLAEIGILKEAHFSEPLSPMPGKIFEKLLELHKQIQDRS